MEDLRIDEIKEKAEESGANRRPDGTFGPKNMANPEGRPPDTPEVIIQKKAIKQIVSEYKEKLAEALPEISPVLIAKALAGDIQAIKEVHDRVMGGVPRDLNLGGNPELPFILKIIKDANNSTTTEGANSEVLPEAI